MQSKRVHLLRLETESQIIVFHEQPYHRVMIDSSILGYRVWKINFREPKPRLQSMMVLDSWEIGVNKSFCLIREEVGVKAPCDFSDCHCGFNAWFHLEDAEIYAQQNIRRSLPSDVTVVGAIAGAGDIRIHFQGFRAEKAQVIALLFNPKGIPREIMNFVSSFLEVPVFTNRQEFLDYTTGLSPLTIEQIKQNHRPEWIETAYPDDSVDDQPSLDSPELTVWTKNGRPHREGDLPAIIYHHLEIEQYWVDGKLHRDKDLPAIVSQAPSNQVQILGAEPLREWWKDGKRHREDDKPAVIHEGTHEWWEDGRRHRDGGKPALVIKIYGERSKKEWWESGVYKKKAAEKPTEISFDITTFQFKERL